MTNTSPLLPLTLSPPAKPTQPENPSPDFSFADAMIALEGRAATSLEVFGAQSNGTTQNTGASSSHPGDTVRASDNTPVKDGVEKGNPPSGQSEKQTPQLSTVDGKQVQAPQAPTVNPSVAVSGLAGAPLQPQGTASPQVQQQAPAARLEAAAQREPGKLSAEPPKAPRPTQPTAPATPPENFAHLLARKLKSGATSFEMRIDPPQLGRVEANLIIGKDGETVLALRFDNSEAFDLFSRDEAGLRAALLSSGFDLDQERLDLSLKEQAEGGEISMASAATSIATSEPLFAAPYSSGAVDLQL